MQYDYIQRLGATDGTPFSCDRRDDFSKLLLDYVVTLSSQVLFVQLLEVGLALQ